MGDLIRYHFQGLKWYLRGPPDHMAESRPFSAIFQSIRGCARSDYYLLLFVTIYLFIHYYYYYYYYYYIHIICTYISLRHHRGSSYRFQVVGQVNK